MDEIQLLTMILVGVLIAMIIAAIILAVVFMKSRSRKNEKQDPKTGEIVKGKTRKYKDYTVESIMDFMEFDTIVDNMIQQKNGMRYIMVVACQGINYDLMSEVEKNSVEEGFIQFLNTIRYPIQIYTQTRTVNLDETINEYKTRMKVLEAKLEKQELNYNQLRRSEKATEKQIERAFFELTKQRNLYEYGKDVIFNTERMSLNKSVLNQKYYVVIPYFVEELGDNQFDKEEQRNYAFSELYTRAQAVIRTLAVSGVNARIMSSNELVELLYMAYNRDEAEIYGIEKALKAGYNELYSTAPDVVDKQMKLLDREIEEAALTKAKDKVEQARTEKQKALQEKRENKQDLIDELARLILEENAQVLGDDIVESAKEKLTQEKEESEKGEQENEAKIRKTRKPRKQQSA